MLAAAVLVCTLPLCALLTADGRSSFAVLHMTIAVAVALHLAVEAPLIEHRRRRALALLALVNPPDRKDGR
ncbi:hypothetical protein SUDANB121_03035 [Nocardiopsis dassonvillei]|uniref:hypothetical protein n=1 Tax=Nocardiopsis dassonvillei TaxID=2014 RepID=UPI003F564522